MLVDLSLKDSKVLIIGGGRIGLRRARTVMKECDDVTLVSDSFAPGAKQAQRLGAKLVNADVADDGVLRRLLSGADLVIAATDDLQLNRSISRTARSLGVMIGSVDDPSHSDFNFPAVRTVGDIRVGVTTGGRSPAMARLICKKLAGSITREDRLRVKLMGHVRDSAKRKLATPAARKAAVYRVLRDEKVGALLRRGRLGEAKEVAEAIIGGA